MPPPTAQSHTITATGPNNPPSSPKLNSLKSHPTTHKPAHKPNWMAPDVNFPMIKEPAPGMKTLTTVPTNANVFRIRPPFFTTLLKWWLQFKKNYSTSRTGRLRLLRFPGHAVSGVPLRLAAMPFPIRLTGNRNFLFGRGKEFSPPHRCVFGRLCAGDDALSRAPRRQIASRSTRKLSFSPRTAPSLPLGQQRREFLR